MLRLVLPDSRYLDSYVEALRQNYRFGLFMPLALADIDRIAQDPADHFAALNAQGVAQVYHAGVERPATLPFNHFWAVEGVSFIGSAFLHYALTPKLEEQVGHIGFSVRASLRRQGYAKKILRLAFALMRARGFQEVLVMADETNVASWKTIESCTAHLLEKVPSSFVASSLQRRYRCGTGADSGGGSGEHVVQVRADGSLG